MKRYYLLARDGTVHSHGDVDEYGDDMAMPRGGRVVLYSDRGINKAGDTAVYFAFDKMYMTPEQLRGAILSVKMQGAPDGVVDAIEERIAEVTA